MASISTLRDNFSDPVFSATQWSTFHDTLTSAAQTGGQVVVTVPSASNDDYAGFVTLSNYDLTSASVSVEVPQVASGRHAETYLELAGPNGFAYIVQYGNYLVFHNEGTGAGYANGQITYNATTHRWWRIRHASSTVFFATSADGETWTNRATDTVRYDITDNTVYLYAGVYAAADFATSAIFDNVNNGSGNRDIVEHISGGGAVTLVSETATTSITSRISGGGLVTYLTQFQPLPQKDYEYRVFDAAGTFISVWTDVASDFAYSQAINQNASDMTVTVGRSPENKITRLDALQDQTGASILDENSQVIYVATETKNVVGPGTDIDENLNVDVYAFYGGYEALLDEHGNQITDENSSAILTQYGAPNGKRVYSGYIVDYNLTYGQNTGVSVRIVPHATEMNHHVFKTLTGNTTVSYNTVDPVVMVRDAMDRYITEGGKITYTTTSMPLSGWVSSYDFKLQTTREVADEAISLLPAGYYHYLHPGENTLYLLPFHGTADHTFYFEQHMTEIQINKSISQLVNDVYFVGGGDPPLFKHYEDTTSQATYRRGLERLSDSRVTLAESAQALSQSDINQYKDPRYKISITITDAAYDIETISLGQMVGFKNSGTFVDDLILRIVNMDRKKHAVSLDLDMIIYNEAKRLEEIKRNILSEQIRNIGTAPV